MTASPEPSDRATDPAVAAELARLRQSIDNIDAALVHLLAERFKATQNVGHLKADKGLPPSDPERERRQIARLREIAVDAQLDPEFAEKWFTFVVAEVIHHHERIAQTGSVDTTGGVDTPDPIDPPGGVGSPGPAAGPDPAAARPAPRPGTADA